jgi:hypothetical protein
MTMLQVWIRSGRIAQLTSRERAAHQAEGVLQGEASSELNVAGCSVPLLNTLFAGDRSVAMSSSEEITGSHLVCEARVPGIDDAGFIEHAKAAKEGCPVSQALAGIEITLDAKLAEA